MFKYGFADVSIGILTNQQSVNEATTKFKKIANDKENAIQHQKLQSSKSSKRYEDHPSHKNLQLTLYPKRPGSDNIK